MPRRALLTSLALLQVLTVALGVGVAVAHERPAPAPAVRVLAAVPASPVAALPVRPAPRPAATHRAAPKKAPVVRKRPTPTPTATRAPRPAATKAPAPVATKAATTTRQLTRQERLMAYVAGIPGYHAGDALWSYKEGLDSWGVAVMGGGTIYLSPSVPEDKLYSVVRHEWSHILSARDYGNNVALAKSEMNRVFGGTGLTGSERAADCMARILGATYTVYTQCTSATWQAAARRLVAGQRLL